MNARPRRGRGPKLVLTATAAAALLLLPACSSSGHPTGTGQLGQISGPVTSPGVNGSGGPNCGPSGRPTATPSTPATPHTSPPVSHAYPTDYANAVLLAWGAKDKPYLTLLTSSSTANQMLGWGNINTHWTLITSEGAAGSSYTMFYNNGGDYIVVRTVNPMSSAHQWHAGSIEKWDQMSFPADPTDYAKKLVSGWMTGNKPRLDYLGTTALTTLLQGKTPPSPDYTATYNSTLKEV